MKHHVPPAASGPEKKKNAAARVAFYGVATAVSVCLSVVDGMIPLSATLPGLKLGLANAVTLGLLLRVDPRGAFFVLLARCFLTAFVLGNLMGFLFSLAGGCLALFVMWLLSKQYDRWFSIYGISVAGACFHHVGQIGVACAVMGTFGVLTYLPVLLFGSVATGALTAFICRLLFARLERARLFAR
jgi:heptaprenyl diphosphate synthase